MLVLQAVIRRQVAFGIEAGGGEEAEIAEPVVDCNDDHAALGDQADRVVVVAFTHHQRATMDPDHDRQGLGVGGRTVSGVKTLR